MKISMLDSGIIIIEYHFCYGIRNSLVINLKLINFQPKDIFMNIFHCVSKSKMIMIETKLALNYETSLAALSRSD